MAFRDDEEALRLKKEALEQQLAEVRTELDDLRPEVARLEAVEKELAETTAELERLRGPKPKSKALPLVLAGALLMIAGLTAGTVILLAQTEQKQEAESRVIAAREAERLAEAEAFRAAEEARLAREAQRAAEEGIARAHAANARAEPAPPAVRRAGRVVEVSGPAPARARARCTLDILPQGRQGSRYSARLVVSCGDRVIYGRPRMGYVPCDMDGDTFVRCEDHHGTGGEGDPMVILDQPTDSLVVSDGPDMPWTVRIALDPVPED